MTKLGFKVLMSFIVAFYIFSSGASKCESAHRPARPTRPTPSSPQQPYSDKIDNFYTDLPNFSEINGRRIRHEEGNNSNYDGSSYGEVSRSNEYDYYH